MRILHIAHYDLNKGEHRTFLDNTTNGLERFLSSLIHHLPESVEQYIVFFDVVEKTVMVQRIKKNNVVEFYSYFYNIEFTESGFTDVFHSLCQELGINGVHIHYLADFILSLPNIFKEIEVPVMATIHDEALLAKDFGKEKDYKRRDDVALFFQNIPEIIFPHEVVCKRFCEFYPEIHQKSRVIHNGVTLPPISKINLDENFKVLFLGGFNFYKGSKIIEALVKEQVDKREFHLLGMIEESEVVFTSKDTYTSKTLVEKMKGINPDIIIIPSIVQEVYPYTAIEATSLGYPILSFPVGSLSWIEQEKRGFNALTVDAKSMQEKLSEIEKIKWQDQNRWRNIYENVLQYNCNSEEEMSNDYMLIYQKRFKSNQQIEINYTFFMKQNFFFHIEKEKELLREKENFRMLNISAVQMDQIIKKQEIEIQNLKRNPIKKIADKLKMKMKKGGLD